MSLLWVAKVAKPPGCVQKQIESELLRTALNNDKRPRSSVSRGGTRHSFALFSS